MGVSGAGKAGEGYMVPEPRGLLLRRYARGTFPWGQGKAGHMGTRDGVQPPEGKVGSSAPCWKLLLPRDLSTDLVQGQGWKQGSYKKSDKWPCRRIMKVM